MDFGKDSVIRMCLATAGAALLLLAPSCTTVANRRPVVASLEAEAEWIAPLGSLQLTCTASDSDGDQLSYEWTANGGSITGTGPQVIWTAPQEVGMYDITVVVDDGRDEKITKSLSLIASNGPPPSIQDLTVTAREPKYLKTTAAGYKVGKTKEYYIECLASGSGGLIYEWSCDGGEISGAGSVITWIAPDTSGDVTVAVKVFDDAANWVSRKVIFQVVSCSSCEFG